MTYSEKLKDPRWQKKRLQILDRDEFACKYCGNENLELHVHHLKYFNNPWDIENKFLVTICVICHKSEHEIKDQPGLIDYSINPEIVEIDKKISDINLKIRMSGGPTSPLEYFEELVKFQNQRREVLKKIKNG